MTQDSARPANGALKTLVMLCQDLDGGDQGLQLSSVAAWLSEQWPGLHVDIVPDLCRQPHLVRERAISLGTERLVLGLCATEYPRPEIEGQARKAGLDPIGLELVVLGEHRGGAAPPGGTEEAKVTLAAAVARAGAFAGSSPESVRPVFLWGEKVSRRSLFTLPPIRYRPVAVVNPERCAAELGCHRCVQACPTQALGWDAEHVRVEKVRCEGCGLCLAACPREAIDLPGHSRAQIEAQLRALLSANPVGLPERRILFACQRTLRAWRDGAHKGAPGWLLLEVPCVGMVPVAAWLHCLTRGAASVGVAPCQADCSLCQAKTIKGRVGYCRQLLHLVGSASQRVTFVGPGDRVPACPSPSNGRLAGSPEGTPHRIFGPEAIAQAVGEVTAGCADGVKVAHPQSPLGTVHISPERCSQCGVCARACPTGSLRLEQRDDATDLTFDAGLCTACGQCLEVCPEAGALVVEQVTDVAKLRQGRVTVCGGGANQCTVCGAPIAPKAMLQRVAHLLGHDAASLTSTIGRYCLACRGQRV